MNVRTHIRLNRVSSTNEFAQYLVSRTRPAEGTVISAIDQYAGRGQALRSWHASPGKNISASFIYYPDFIPAKDQFRLNMFFSVSALRFFSRFLRDERILIKWPNDLLIGASKAAGMLIRVSSAGTHLRQAILGIGFNIFEDRFPAEIPDPVSLCRYSDQIPDIPELIDAFQEHLWADYEKFKAGRDPDLEGEYALNLFGMGEQLHFSSPETGPFEGVIRGVDEFGRLLIRTMEGRRAFHSGSLVFK